MHEFERLKIFNEYELKHEKITNCKKLGINYSEALLCHKLPANTNHEQGKVHIQREHVLMAGVPIIFLL